MMITFVCINLNFLKMNESNLSNSGLEGRKPSNVNFAMINGMYMGVALIIFSLILYVLDVPHDNFVQYFSYVIMIAFTFVFVKQWRDKHNGGFLSYGGAFSNGFLTILFATILSAIYTYIFFQLIAPGEIQVLIAEAEEKMYENPNMTEEQVELAMKYTAMMMTPIMMSVWVTVGGAIGGAVISALLAIFLKKEPKEF